MQNQIKGIEAHYVFKQNDEVIQLGTACRQTFPDIKLLQCVGHQQPSSQFGSSLLGSQNSKVSDGRMMKQRTASHSCLSLFLR